MHLYLIAELAKQRVDVLLHRAGLFAGALELDEERGSARNKKAAVGEPTNALNLEVLNAQLAQDSVAGRTFDFGFKHRSTSMLTEIRPVERGASFMNAPRERSMSAPVPSSGP